MAEPLIVSLDEFAELCGITAETMRVYVRAVDGSPAWLIEKGDRGRAYKIEAAGAVEWWQGFRDAQDLADVERRNRLAQMRLDLVGDVAEPSDRLALSGRQRREEYDAAWRGVEFRKMMGQLVEKSELQHVLTGAAVELRRRLMLCPGEFAISAGLDPDHVRPLEGIIARAVDAFVTALAPIGVVPTEDQR